MPAPREQIYQAVLTKDPQNQLALHRLGVLAAKSGRVGQGGRVPGRGRPVRAAVRPTC